MIDSDSANQALKKLDSDNVSMHLKYVNDVTA